MNTLDRWARATMAVVIAAAAAYLLYRLRFVLVTVALAAMLAYALLPLVDRVSRMRPGGRPMPRLLAVLAVYLVVGVAVTAVFRLAMGPVANEAQRFALNVEQYRDQVGAFLTQTQTALRRGVPAPLVPPIEHALGQAEATLLGAVTGMVRGTARWIANLFEVVLIPILAFYFLLDLPMLRTDLLGFLPAGTRTATLLAARRADRIMAGYVRAQIALMVISGVVVGIGLAVIGVRFPLLLGILAGLTRAIPIIGPVLGAIPIVGIAALQSSGLALAVLVFFVILQLAESKIVLPKIIGHELKLQPVTILLALLIGNAFFGMMGMFLAAPAAAFAKALREMGELPAPAEPEPAVEAPPAPLRTASAPASVTGTLPVRS